MGASYRQLYIHLVWGTWNRMPLIREEIRDAIQAAIAGAARDMNCRAIAIGGTADHMHVLLEMHPAISISDLVRQIKGSTSHLVSNRLAPGEFFKWQRGYGAFTVSKERVQDLIEYVSRQEEHHKRGNVRRAIEIVG